MYLHYIIIYLLLFVFDCPRFINIFTAFCFSRFCYSAQAASFAALLTVTVFMSSDDDITYVSAENYHEILPHLYIGDKRLASDLQRLQILGITAIVNVTHDIRHYYEDNTMFNYIRCAA